MIIAEIGSVHDGSFGNALKCIDMVHGLGADAVKFQTHIAEFETLVNAPNPRYFRGESRFDYFKRTSFTLEQWSKLRSHASALGIQFISSPFSLEAVELLTEISVDYVKIPSGEVTNLPLLDKVSASGLPSILSTGMSDWAEIDNAASRLSSGLCCIMQCTSAYPCPIEKVGVNIIDQLLQKYPHLKIGFSDHTNSHTSAVVASFLGATVIEKHLTFSRLMYGSDAANAYEPSDFAEYISLINEAIRLKQSPIEKNDIKGFKDMRETFMKSIVYNQPLPSGTQIKSHHLAFKKPGTGLSPELVDSILDKTLTCDVSSDMIAEMDHFQ